ncbi:MAG: hypothetical protein A3F10_03050 [Coxiella sp. RIFCSPHIGHO2_12_FULL_42_15]|nr:MAG: hypothetical protein A3F10_03050 [Coxiella sp. RIFCSPHIGHO2_12_FULL_42_15]
MGSKLATEAYLERAYISGFTSLEETPELRKEIVAYVNQLRDEIVAGPVQKYRGASLDFYSLVREASHFLLYRSMLGLANTDIDYDYDYLKFVNAHPVYLKQVADTNPFLIKMHLVNLFNNICRINLMYDGKIKANNLLMSQFFEYVKAVQDVATHVNALDIKKYGIFKWYLHLLVIFTFAMSMYNSNNVQCYDLQKSKILLELAYSIAYLLEHIAPDTEMLDLLTCGKNLSDEIGFSRLSDFRDYILSFEIWTNEEKSACLQRAIELIRKVSCKKQSNTLFSDSAQSVVDLEKMDAALFWKDQINLDTYFGGVAFQ